MKNIHDIHSATELINYTIDIIGEFDDSSNIFACDLHNEIFNTDYYVVGTLKAKKWAGEHVFEMIKAIVEYEEANFGELQTDISDPEKVVNMYVYIAGELILNESKTLREKWDERLESEDLKAIQNELKVVLEQF